jgi:hypothetical protein
MENQIINDMKRILMKLSMAAFLLMPVLASAQKKSDPQGSLTYCLPSTVINLEVEAMQEKFYAGPYAKFAEKYLGIKVRQKDETSYQLVQVNLTPAVEADQSARHQLFVDKGKIDASFLKLSSAGLVSFSDAAAGGETKWRFPARTTGDFSNKGVSSNLTSEATVLYKNDRKESEYNKVSVQQNMIVAKTPEQKAAETAEMILDLRKQRLQIVTGDTDATYSGEAMAAAIDELTRLEKEYLTLFTGYSETQMQKMNFEIIPDPARENQKYIAFRLSDTAGLVPADNLSGKPVVMEFLPQRIMPEEKPAEKESKKLPAVFAYYRIPAICTVKLMEGMDILLQSRMPVYQLGVEASLPVNVILK